MTADVLVAYRGNGQALEKPSVAQPHQSHLQSRCFHCWSEKVAAHCPAQRWAAPSFTLFVGLLQDADPRLWGEPAKEFGESSANGFSRHAMPDAGRRAATS